MSKIKLQATDGNGGTISLKGPTTTDGNAEFELTLPANDGSANEYLKTNGSGVLSWDAPGGGISDVVSDTSPQLGGDLDTNDFEIKLDDSHNIKFGDGDGSNGADLKIRHDGTNNHIEGLNGSTYIGAVSNVEIRSTDSAGSNAKWMGRFYNDAQVELFHNNSLKFATSTTGIAVTGHIKADGGFGIMEPCFNATMGDDLAINNGTQTTNTQWQNSGAAMNPGWDSTNDYFKVPTGGAGHYVFIWTIKVGDNHQGHLDQGEIIDTSLAKNGTILDKSRKRDTGQDNLYFCSTGFYSCELADGDEIQMTHYQNEGGRLDLDDLQCSFCGFRIAEGD